MLSIVSHINEKAQNDKKPYLVQNETLTNGLN